MRDTQTPTGSLGPTVVRLATLDVDAVEQCGGKGANLGELIASGVPVPPGFCVTTAAYRRAIAANSLDVAMEEALQDVHGDDPASSERAAARIALLLEKVQLPEQLREEILASYRALGMPPVAVRSSATAEDLPGASFAGQHATSLNVRGPDELLDAVRHCWASLWSARAIAYREHHGLQHDPIAIAVVVQRLVAADVSGVLFTANPVNGARDEIVVDAARGLGEAVVGGSTTPDSFTLDRATLVVRSRRSGRQEVETVLGEHGTQERSLEPGRPHGPALNDAQLAALARIGLTIEDRFGTPQDVEWAYADGRFWVLQARPITNLPPEPLAGVRWEASPGSAWWRRQVVENLPEPLSPLFDELYVREGLERSIDALMELFRNVRLRLDDVAERPMFTTINGFAYSRANYKLSWRSVPKLLHVTVEEFRIMFGGRMVAYWRDEALPAYLAAVDRWEAADPGLEPDQSLLAGVRELAFADARYWLACSLMVGRAKITDALLGRYLAHAAPGRRLTSGMFLRGFPSPTVDAETELEGLARHLRDSDELRALVVATPAAGLLDALAGRPAGRRWLTAFARYLDRYGHQVYNLDFVVPTQADDPLPVLVGLKTMTQRPGRDPRARQRSLIAERDALVEATSRSLGPSRRRIFAVLLDWAQRCGPDREQALFYMGAGWPVLRRLALELGRRLVESGSLDLAEDVFFLQTSEIRTALSAREAGRATPGLASMARRRRELREARKRLHPPALVPEGYRVRFGPFDLSAFETQRRDVVEGDTLRGSAVSPGRASGVASVILSPADFARMEPGTILVCRTTTPAWTPLFSQALGLVTDVGGVLAHGSIVAREYGIPAVLGTGSASRRICHGQRITVDGDRGVVVILEPDDPTTAVPSRD